MESAFKVFQAESKWRVRCLEFAKSFCRNLEKLDQKCFEMKKKKPLTEKNRREAFEKN